MELKTARLTVLVDPAKKKAFEALCARQDVTPSQVMLAGSQGYLPCDEGRTAGRSARARRAAPRPHWSRTGLRASIPAARAASPKRDPMTTA